MSRFVSMIQAFSPTLWEQHGLAPHTLTLLQVSKEMVEAVCYVGRAALPAHVYAKPSQIREVLYWNRLMYNRLDLTRVKLTVQFMPETDMDGYLGVARNVIDGLKYMPNAVRLDFSQLEIVGDNGHEIVNYDWFTGELDKNYWTDYNTNDFFAELVKTCVLLEELHLGVVVRDVLLSSWDEADDWNWVNALPNLRTLSAVDMGIDDDVAENVMNVVSQYTTLTELNMDYNNIRNLLYILPESFNLASLSFSGCDLSGGAFEGMISVSTAGVSKLLTEYPSLVYLDLIDNQYCDEEGEAIAEALRLNTNLMKLDLRENHICPAVREQIANAWKPRKAANLLLDEWSDEPDMEDETLLLENGSDELDMEDE